MRKLPAPRQSASDTFLACVARLRDAEDRLRLTALEPAVVRAEDEFRAASAAASLHSYRIRAQDAADFDVVEMAYLYEVKMARKGAPARTTYDSILAAPPHGRCPLCAQRTVSTLDHHLPKAIYPTLSVTPINLVPACGDCNKVKSDVLPLSEGEQTLNPYFDDMETAQWLFAEVIEVQPAAVRFLVRPPENWPAIVGQRLQRHFTVFGLASLYSSHAAEELVNIRYTLRSVHAATGAVGVREHLLLAEASRRAAHLNSWQTALYQALHNNNWFCSGGYQ